MLSNVYDIRTVVAHLRVSPAHAHSVRIHQSPPLILSTEYIFVGDRKCLFTEYSKENA